MDDAAQLAVSSLLTGPGVTLFASTGDWRLDSAFGVLLADLSARFMVRPGFSFYDDGPAKNAKALTVSAFPGTRGTVLFGTKLLRWALAADVHGDLFALCVCAHEFAHIVQNNTPFRRRLQQGQQTKRPLELHADFLAGYFFGSRGASYTPAHLIALGKAWQAIGDTNFTHPEHHGTPSERLGAIETGFRIAQDRPEFDVLEMCEIGARYLKV